MIDTDDVGVAKVDEDELSLRVVLFVSSELEDSREIETMSLARNGLIWWHVAGAGVVVAEMTSPGGYGHQ